MLFPSLARKRISPAGGRSPSWRADGKELFYQSGDGKLMAVGLNVGRDTVEPYAPRELFPLQLRSSAGPTYEPSGDGQRFLILASPETAVQSLSVIVNWPALLKKATAAP
jgi:hypothetical protein